ncbi:MAG: hypothetical protein C5B52_16310 [Bacteroidetes bacterium]|nr:MAG: hypothetical protein C5B52_16310 [Bacteroidota bacterium]
MHLNVSVYLRFRIFTIVEYCFLAAFLLIALKSIKIKRIILILSSIFVIISGIDLFTTKADTFDSVPVAIEAILIIIYCIYFLYEQIVTPTPKLIYASADFWVVVALLLYFCGTFFLYIYSQNYLGDSDFNKKYDIINSFFYILKNLILGLAMCVKAETRNSSISHSKRIEQAT